MHCAVIQMVKSDASPANCAMQFVRHWQLRSNPMSAKMELAVRAGTTLTCLSAFIADSVKRRAPVDAIVETRIHEYHMESPGENIMTKDKLLAIGDKYDAMISADKAADAPYR